MGTKKPRPSRRTIRSGWNLDRGGLMLRRTGPALLGAALALCLPAVAHADTLEAANNGALADSVAINSIWVMVAALLVIFMQAGFAFLEIGFSRAKNAGTVVAKILTNFSIAGLMYWAVRLRLRLRHRRDHRPRRLLPARLRRSSDGLPGDGPVGRHDRDEVDVPVLVLRRLARDRLGDDARADQVRRLHHLRDPLRRVHLPDRVALGVRRRLAAGEPRHAGLRRLDGGPPDRRHRRAGRAAAARRRGAASTGPTGARGRSRATRCRCSASAC